MALVKDTQSRFPYTKVAISCDGKSDELWRVSDKSTLVIGGGNASDMVIVNVTG